MKKVKEDRRVDSESWTGDHLAHRVQYGDVLHDDNNTSSSCVP